MEVIVAGELMSYESTTHRRPTQAVGQHASHASGLLSTQVAKKDESKAQCFTQGSTELRREIGAHYP